MTVFNKLLNIHLFSIHLIQSTLRKDEALMVLTPAKALKFLRTVTFLVPISVLSAKPLITLATGLTYTSLIVINLKRSVVSD